MTKVTWSEQVGPQETIDLDNPPVMVDYMGKATEDPDCAIGWFNPATGNGKDFDIWTLKKIRGDTKPLPHTQANYDTAKHWLLRHHAFYGSFLVSLACEWMYGIPVAATDGSRILYNPETCADLTQAEWRFLMAHEVMHVAHLHSFRKRERNHKLWNIATDITINELITEGKNFQPVKGALLPIDDPNTGMMWAKYAGQSPEWIYKDLYDNAEVVDGGQPDTGGGSDGDKKGNSTAGDDDTTDGSAQGKDQAGDQTDANGNLDPDKLGDRGRAGNQAGTAKRHVKIDWLHGDVLPPCDLTDAERNAAATKIKQLAAKAAYHAQAMGSDEQLAKDVLAGTVPPGSWQMKLRNFVSSVVEKDDYSWAKPNRRYVDQGIYYPTLTGNKPPKLMAIVIDISVSVSIDQLNKMWEEVAGVIATHPNLTFETFFVNTQVMERRKIGIADLPLEFDVRGCGGTCFRPAFEVIEEEGLEVSGLVYFTDMECYSYAPEPCFPVIWLNFDHPIHMGATEYPPYGEVVNMI